MAQSTNAAAYIRMSSDKQETSPEQQKSEIEAYADRQGYSIVEWYQDSGVSGDQTEKRLSFQQMIADGSTGRFKTVLCWDQDRFGRFDLIEAGKWIHPLRQAGVTLDTVTGGKTDWANLVDQLSYMAKQMGKHQYLQDLARNVRRGHATSFANGKWVSGFAPFGYAKDAETGKLILGPLDEVRIVREVFTRYADGVSPASLVRWINDKGVKTRQGNIWQRRTIDHMLSNQHYLGHMVRRPQNRSKYLDGVDQWQVIEGTHEPIIDQALWERTQARRVTNRTSTSPTGKHQYPLTGLIYCGSCGGRMGGGAPHGKRHYKCLSYDRGAGECERRTVNESELLPVVLREIRKQYFDPLLCPENRVQIKEALRQQLTADNSETSRQRARDAQALDRINDELDKAVAAMIATSEDLRPLVEQRVRKLQDERDQLADKLSQQAKPAGQQIKRIEERMDAAIGWLDRLEELIGTDYDPIELGRVLRQFVSKVEVDTRRTPVKPGAKRHTTELIGGRIYLQVGALSGCVNMLPPSGKSVQVYATPEGEVVIEWSVAA